MCFFAFPELWKALPELFQFQFAVNFVAAKLRRKLSIRKVVPLLAHFRSLKGRSDEQQLLLDALSSDFTLEYEFLAQIGDSFNGIDAMVSLLPGVHRSQLRLFLALTKLPRLREYIKVYKRCE
ncbi:hypothetical protein AK812_SmicGene45874, partial [Symbiodinium microadriaticum]